LYGAVWGIFRKSAVTLAPHGATLKNASILFIESVLAQSEHSSVGNRWKLELCTVHLSKIAVPGSKSQIADRKIADKLYGKSYENFQPPGFPHNFSKHYRLQLKLAVWTRLDVSYNL
jgi:hypothetical protein